MAKGGIADMRTLGIRESYKSKLMVRFLIGFSRLPFAVAV